MTVEYDPGLVPFVTGTKQWGLLDWPTHVSKKATYILKHACHSLSPPKRSLSSTHC